MERKRQGVGIITCVENRVCVCFLKRWVCVDESRDAVGSVCLERPGSMCL